MKAQAAIRAIIARIQGNWDQPDLVTIGPLGETRDDILRIAQSVEPEDQEEEADNNPFHPESPEGRAWERGELRT
ncbi:hypothetical protein [uncultured Bosea sp.]|uniref:hypothetical protein n=1 Tax=uncultured Bosea sp. TaxID=211457 RepID=UPI0025FB133D|nr:hypothetical protein [uncultured Bosea sp.]